MIHPYELIDGGLYKVGATVVRYNVITNNFYRLDGKILGFLTRFQRSLALGCRVGTPTEPLGYDWKNEHIKPIPITAEILEKNGFTKVNSQRYDYGCPDTDCYVKVNPKKNMIHVNGRNANCNLYYHPFVHEMQRALRICGVNELADSIII